MGLVVNVRHNIGSNVSKRVDCAECEVDQEPADKHKSSAKQQQLSWPLKREQRFHDCSSTSESIGSKDMKYLVVYSDTSRQCALSLSKVR